MDFTIDHAINTAVRAHPLLVTILSDFATWGVTAFGVAVFLLWLFDAPRVTGPMRRAAASGLGAAALGLALNQVVIAFWHRPRPYESHPHQIVPLISPSHDPSFPSDHATAAFAIAFGILFVTRRTGLLFLGWAALIALSRVLVGVHYPSDVLAGLVIGLVAGFVVARLAAPLIAWLVALVARLTDPLLERLEELRAVRSTLGSPRFRERATIVIGVALLVAFAARMTLPDELPLAALACWILVVAGAAWLVGRGRRDPAVVR